MQLHAEKQQAGGAPAPGVSRTSHGFWIFKILEQEVGGVGAVRPRIPPTFAARSHTTSGDSRANQACTDPPDRAGSHLVAARPSKTWPYSLAARPGRWHSPHAPMTATKIAVVLLESSS